MKINLIKGDCLEHIVKISNDVFIISDPPYNQSYHYSEYRDNLNSQQYRDLLFQVFNSRKSVIILYPEETVSILATLDLGKIEQVVSWVYNSNTAKTVQAYILVEL